MLFRDADKIAGAGPNVTARELAVTVLTGAIRGGDAYAAIRHAVQIEEGVVRIGNRFLAREGLEEVAFIAAGNAAAPMAAAFHDTLGEVVTQGLLIAPTPPPTVVPFPSHVVLDPLGPTPESTRAAQDALELAEGLGPKDLLVVLLSPGALGMLASPAPGVGLTEQRELLQRAAAHRGPSEDLVALASALSPAEAGGLARAASRAAVEALVVERGEGGPLIGGGPVAGARPEARARAQHLLGEIMAGSSVSPGVQRRIDLLGTSFTAGVPGSSTVVVAGPGEALEEAGAEAADHKHRARLVNLHDAGSPEEAASRFLAAVEAAFPELPEKPGEGLALLSGLSLGTAEGQESTEELSAFLGAAQSSLRHRNITVAALATSGSLRPDITPSGGIVDALGRFDPAPLAPGRLDLRAGLTDVGVVALALITRGEAGAKPGAPPPAPRSFFGRRGG